MTGRRIKNVIKRITDFFVAHPSENKNQTKVSHQNDESSRIEVV